jgi:hypothetical protein
MKGHTLSTKRGKQKKTIDLDKLVALSYPSTAASWVNLLLLHMYKDSIKTYILDHSQGIPPVPHDEELPDGELNFESIINRLKVMVSLDPVKYKAPKKGSVSLFLGGIWYTADMIFDDSNDKSSCSITLTTEGKHVSSGDLKVSGN